MQATQQPATRIGWGARVRRRYRRTVEEQRLEYQFWLTILLLTIGAVFVVFRPETFERMTTAAAIIVAWWFGRGSGNTDGKDNNE